MPSFDRNNPAPKGFMRYQDFVWFILSEEDKTTNTSISFWFQCIDFDEDGIISPFELEFFYAEQRQKMKTYQTDQITFEDFYCQISDIIKPHHPNQITLSELKQCKQTHYIFNFLFNLGKFISIERDLCPFDKEENQISDWSRFSIREYRKAVEEQSA